MAAAIWCTSFSPVPWPAPAVCFQLTGRIVLQWDAFRRATLYENDNFFALGPGTQTDGAAGRIVPHTVGEQVVYRSAEQEGVGVDGGQGLRRQIHLEAESLPQPPLRKSAAICRSISCIFCDQTPSNTWLPTL